MDELIYLYKRAIIVLLLIIENMKYHILSKIDKLKNGNWCLDSVSREYSLIGKTRSFNL